MSLSIQKANFWKRISAYLFDLILTVMLTVGIAALLSAALGYGKQNDRLEAYYQEYETTYGVDFDITEEEKAQLSEEEKATYQAATDAFLADERVGNIYEKMFFLTLVIVSLSVLLAILTVQFIAPLFFHNGQTLGKKIFGLAVMRSNCVKLSNPVLFIRSILGMYTIETMFPLVLLIMIYFGFMGGAGTLTIGLLLLLQLGVLIGTKYRSSIHDLLSDTIVVDMASQRIFDTQEAMLAYKKELHEQEVAQKEYI